MIVVIMGVAGSGKTTIGTMLAEALRCGFLDGDCLHPPSNIEKMSHGIPLTDADRQPWLQAIHAQIAGAYAHKQNLVVACSALKSGYREVLAAGIAVTWVYLKGSADLIRARMARRREHFMKAIMLPSQFAVLEEPSDAIVEDVALPPVHIVEDIVTRLPDRTAADSSAA